MAATKRNAGLTSAVPRATLNDEELVSAKLYKYDNWLRLYMNIKGKLGWNTRERLVKLRNWEYCPIFRENPGIGTNGGEIFLTYYEPFIFYSVLG